MYYVKSWFLQNCLRMILDICDKFTNKSLFKTNEQGELLRDSNGDIEKIKYDN